MIEGIGIVSKQNKSIAWKYCVREEKEPLEKFAEGVVVLLAKHEAKVFSIGPDMVIFNFNNQLFEG